MERKQYNEQEIKVALISKLYQKGALRNAALINEMVIANWSRRADLALANGHLQAFEIKSDFDSLKRLDGQLATYISRFEKVTVVCVAKFTDLVLKMAHPNVEILEVASSNAGPMFRLVRRGRLSRLRDKNILLGFLRKADIQMILRDNDIRFPTNAARHTLEKLAASISSTKLREFVLGALKSRYNQTSGSYISRLEGLDPTSPADLEFLSKSKQERKLSVTAGSVVRNTPGLGDTQRWLALDLKKIQEKYGRLPDGMPGVVLRRARTTH